MSDQQNLLPEETPKAVDCNVNGQGKAALDGAAEGCARPPVTEEGGQLAREARLPGGTYPVGQAANPSNVPPVAAEPVRRVGRITAALGFIAFGVALVLQVFNIGPGYVMLARLSPVLLVFLGGEILWASFKYGQEKIKVEFLILLLTLLMVTGGMVAAVVPEVWVRQHQADRVARRLSSELEQTAYSRLAEVEGIQLSSVEWWVQLYGDDFTLEMAPKDIKGYQSVTAVVRLQQQYQSKEAFAADCLKIMQQLEAVAPHIDHLEIYSWPDYSSDKYYGEVRYSLQLGSRWQMKTPQQELLALVESHYWNEREHYYLDEYDYRYREAHPDEFWPYEASSVPQIDENEPADGSESLSMAS